MYDINFSEQGRVDATYNFYGFPLQDLKRTLKVVHFKLGVLEGSEGLL
jgi:hypothetical protein